MPCLLIALLCLVIAGCSHDGKQENQAGKSQADIHSTLNARTADDDHGLPLHKLQVPEGFNIAVYCADVPAARSMARGNGGTIFVSTRASDVVYAIRDPDGDNYAEEVKVIAEDMTMPNGVAMHNGDLYVAEVSRVWRFPAIERHLDKPRKELVRDDFPTDRSHGWKFIRFGPDGYLYIPVGAPCNVCEEEDERYATIMRMRPDGSDLQVFAHGVRNSVGFDFHPDTKELWFTDNGRDWLGDDQPSDELNHAPRAGLHFGFPYCHAGMISDDEFCESGDCCSDERYRKPAKRLGPHVAALGMRFYTGAMFPEQYHNAIFIAEHGSWNRSDKIGYRVGVALLNGNAVRTYRPLVEGWLQDGDEVWGRPVDVMQMPDGALLISDDHAGAIYRLSYKG